MNDLRVIFALVIVAGIIASFVLAVALQPYMH